jgi:hypothetical protein
MKVIFLSMMLASHRMSIRLISILVCTMIAPAALSWADGAGRPATKAEKNFMQRVYAVMNRALPASGPDGWQEVERGEAKVTDRVTVGTELSPMRLYYGVRWEDTARKEAARQKREERYMRPDNLPPNPDQSRQQRLEELAGQAAAAATRGDMNTFQKLQKEIDELGTQMYAPANTADRQRSDEDKATIPRDASVILNFTVNESRVAILNELNGPAKQEPIAGNLAYRLSGESFSETRIEWDEGQTCVLVGTWKPGSKAGQKVVSTILNMQVPHTTVQNFTVCATAESKRARSLLEKVNWGALKNALE